ncbi:MAG: uracil phosphoribosyltransferase [Mycoplasmataceae bacterium]|nr:uracil phosphoribosyltransferase [Mycoplasmataceae bacterium]MBR3259574.1 uracil phosphoribosyltransferase [Mycoplasmataceae bacterium]MBR3571450.1 uracil phosphoribosyltransferase [Mycoplasmataceae bacterium]MBR3832623.1 uracil phosphoribosyltransferase [Mycoplasmataceae bacterium]MBR4025356.1 uracil phosphoribosyltransferase [Mycoplasmataceae bacterium]
MINIKVLDHPLIKIKLTVLRDKETNHTEFKANLNEIASLMVFEMLRDYKTKDINIETPTKTKTIGQTFDKEIVIVPILRAGIGMVEGIQNLVPQARVGHIGLYRDEKTLEAHEYFYKMPNVSKDSVIIVVDPMLATGGSAVDAINKLKQDGFKNIKMVSLVGAPEGIENLKKHTSNIDLYIASIDEKLNEEGYIIPGLGDAGDRIFGTK